MKRVLLRAASVLGLVLLGILLAPGAGLSPLAGAAWGGAAGGLALLAEAAARASSTPRLAGAVAGLALGWVLAGLLRLAVGPSGDLLAPPLSGVLLALTLGLAGALALSERFARRGLLADAKDRADAGWKGAAAGRPKVMDTSVIIDGRIADIVEAGFVEGRVIVPQFVLRELQQVADSSDPLKRNRGRKGLDVLRGLQQSSLVEVELTGEDTADVRDVDAKLLWLAQRRGAKVLTNDYNLNKIAQLRGIDVLNVNDLANAVRPVFLPGEELTIQVIKEGKERHQGIGYLDDGTMVVVENGRRLLGQKLGVLVTSVIQTNAGKMIFATAEDDDAPEVRPRVLRRVSERDLPVPAAHAGAQASVAAAQAAQAAHASHATQAGSIADN